MAKFINQRNHLENDYKKYRKKAGVWWLATVSFFMGFILYGNSKVTSFDSPFPGVLIFMIGFAVSGVIANLNTSRVNALKSGLVGENKAKSVFQGLSNDYYVLSDLFIEVDGKSSQVDNIVVGSNGIFVIETKNNNGRIVGYEGEKQITQHKIGRRGGEYSKSMYNPIKQVGTQVYRVSELLKKNNINTWVEGAVFFTNNTCQVELESSRIPVFAASEGGSTEILKYISSYENSNSNISENRKEEIVNILGKYCIGEDGLNHELKSIDIFSVLGSMK